MTAEIVAEPVLGWRTWLLCGGRLRSLAVGDVWHAGVQVASCAYLRHHNQVPDRLCSCGIYALKSPVAFPFFATHSFAYGQVELWGRIVEHAQGYRAQYARPHRLAVYADRFGPSNTNLCQLGEYYKCPVQIVDVESYQRSEYQR